MGRKGGAFRREVETPLLLTPLGPSKAKAGVRDGAPRVPRTGWFLLPQAKF